MQNPAETELEETLLAEPPRDLERAVGLACAAVALALITFAFCVLVNAAVGDHRNLAPASVLLIVSAGAAFFFASVGYRLLLNKPNSVGSVAGPFAWKVIFGFFALLTVAFAIGSVAVSDLTLAQGAALSGILALLAFGAASHFHKRK